MQTKEDQIVGGIWSIGPVTAVSGVKLLGWRVFEVQQAGHPGRTRHFVGSTGWHFDGQVSSAIVRYDPATRCGKTESGRVYQLVGPGSGIGMNASYVWNAWLSKCSATVAVDVTAEIEELLLMSWSDYDHPRGLPA